MHLSVEEGTDECVAGCSCIPGYVEVGFLYMLEFGTLIVTPQGSSIPCDLSPKKTKTIFTFLSGFVFRMEMSVFQQSHVLVTMGDVATTRDNQSTKTAILGK